MNELLVLWASSGYGFAGLQSVEQPEAKILTFHLKFFKL